MERFRNIVIMVNPASTRAERVKLHVRQLTALFAPEAATVVPTLPDGRAANQALLRAHQDRLGPETLLVVAAGDGTASLVVEALLTDPALAPAARETTLLPLWGGNGNDLAQMLNGPAMRAQLPRLLQDGRVVEIRPMAIRLTGPGGEVAVRLAVNYATFGASAAAAYELNHPSHRDDPLRETLAGLAVSELTVVTRAMLKAPRFALQDGDEMRLVYERAFINGSRMAKTGVVPLKLTDPHFYHVTVEHKQASALVRQALELTNPAIAPKFKATRAAFTTKEPAWAQFDGESLQIEPDTHVSVSLAPRPFRALSRLL